jgi:hypothetical protein
MVTDVQPVSLEHDWLYIGWAFRESIALKVEGQVRLSAKPKPITRPSPFELSLSTKPSVIHFQHILVRYNEDQPPWLRLHHRRGKG